MRQADASPDPPMLDELVNALEPTVDPPPHAIAHAETTRRHRLSRNRVSHDSVEASDDVSTRVVVREEE